MAALHDGASQKASLPTTFATFQHAWPRSDAKRFCHNATKRAHETVNPAGALQIGGASYVIREKSLELGEGFRKSKIASLMDIHYGHSESRRLHTSTKRHAPPSDTH
jgi:hypothetical protein